MKNLIKTIQNTAFQSGLWAKGSKIVLGVSGGPDSVCLLDVMAKIAPKYDLELIIAHVNYGLREKDSDRDEKFVKELAEKYGIKIEILKVPRAKLLEFQELSSRTPSENDLRNIRYDFFERVREENKFDLIAVAHNADDQVETFLMRIIRGSGLQGLSAMKYKSGNLIRPLLGLSRKEILEYLDRTNRTYRTDRTNVENLFLRNKIRNKLIPFLEKNFNPKIKETIFSATASIAEDYALIQKLADKTYRTNGTNKADGTNFLSVKKLLSLHPSLQRMVLRNFLMEKKSDLKDIEASHIEEILKALRSKKSKNQVVLFKGLKLTRKGDKLHISIQTY